MFEIAAAILSIALVLIFVYLRWNFNYWQKRGVRGPSPVILKGNFTKSARGECNFIEELDDIYLKYKHSEKFVGIFVSRDPRLFVLDPEIARQVLITNFSNFHDNESSRWSIPKIELLRCQSPFVCVGENWKQKRSEIVPALTVNRLRSAYPAMQQTAKKLSDFIIASRKEKELNVKELAGRFTSEAVSDFIWGINSNAFSTEKLCEVHEIANGMINQSLRCVGYYVKTAAFPWIRKLRPQRFFPESTDKFFSQLTKNLIEHRLENPNDRLDVINHLITLSNKKSLTDAQLAGHTTTVLIDGFESAAIAISHCLLLLSRNKSAQEKLRNEISENCDDENSISFDRLNDLPYLDQCIHETLRIFPPLPAFMKICTTSTVLENSSGRKLLLRPGDSVFISAYSFHKDGDIFERPEEFLPERFDPSVGGYRKYRDRGVFFPFGDGPRMCLGMKLGLLETKVAVAEIVRNFKISLSSSTRTDNRTDPFGFLLSVEGGITLSFTPVL